MKKFIAVSGSLRKDSYNTCLLRAAQKLMGEEATIELYDISSIPLFNADSESSFPSEAQKFKDTVLFSDGVIFATPEYNRSVPGVLKNAIDWASRPYGKNAFDRKAVLVLGVSTGTVSAAVAQIHLKSIMTYLNTRLVAQPEFYMGPAEGKFDKEGNLTDEKTKEALTKALKALLLL